jgi:hypothetical protein
LFARLRFFGGGACSSAAEPPPPHSNSKPKTFETTTNHAPQKTQAFKEFDADGDGRISEAELAAALAKFGVKDDPKKLLESADENKVCVLFEGCRCVVVGFGFGFGFWGGGVRGANPHQRHKKNTRHTKPTHPPPLP